MVNAPEFALPNELLFGRLRVWSLCLFGQRAGSIRTAQTRAVTQSVAPAISGARAFAPPHSAAPAFLARPAIGTHTAIGLRAFSLTCQAFFLAGRWTAVSAAQDGFAAVRFVP